MSFGIPTTINKVLVPIDHSEPSLEAAWVGLTVANALHATLTLMHVNEHSTLEFTHVNYLEFDRLSHDSFHNSVLKYVDDPYSNELCSAVNNGIVEVDCQRCENRPAVEICSYARSQGINLIVMGSRGHSSFGELLIGSVSTEVLHHAPCPVTIVR